MLRRADKITEAGQLMLNPPHEADDIYNPEEWWVERRVLARKLLDVGEHKTAYLTMRDAVEPDERELTRRTAVHGRLDRAALSQ